MSEDKKMIIYIMSDKGVKEIEHAPRIQNIQMKVPAHMYIILLQDEVQFDP